MEATDSQWRPLKGKAERIRSQQRNVEGKKLNSELLGDLSVYIKGLLARA